MVREGYGRRVPVDPRIIEDIQRSSAMMAEQGTGFMSEWGGPQVYQEMGRAPVEARMVYYAALEGHVDPGQIEIVTGLGPGEVSKGLGWLQSRGYIEFKEV